MSNRTKGWKYNSSAIVLLLFETRICAANANILMTTFRGTTRDSNTFSVAIFQKFFIFFRERRGEKKAESKRWKWMKILTGEKKWRKKERENKGRSLPFQFLHSRMKDVLDRHDFYPLYEQEYCDIEYLDFERINIPVRRWLTSLTKSSQRRGCQIECKCVFCDKFESRTAFPLLAPSAPSAPSAPYCPLALSHVISNMYKYI